MEHKLITWDSVTGEHETTEIDIPKDAPLEEVCGIIDKHTNMDETGAHVQDVECMTMGGMLIIGRRWTNEVMYTVDIVIKEGYNCGDF
jgi:hypothetical protein